MNKFMEMAVKEAEEGIHNGHGGPFGAVIVKDGIVIGKGHNHVVINNDPTCHGEVDAIRNACKNLKSFDLKGAEIYTTGEPCPMCLGAILWSNIEHIYYGCSIQENDMIGFRDEIFYKNLEISTEKMKDKISQVDHEECLKLFEEYQAIQNKTMY
ncbi:nucleoside deaminase [uncultured Clostridium sp.]|uniref:nucleoside deaminase n=1 Tax=uncultured Clostridium sp. TaxID=59620 RepID=UPI0026069F6D|nr:nucleoside deaminase [uncultured Clostridium sp.]